MLNLKSYPYALYLELLIKNWPILQGWFDFKTRFLYDVLSIYIKHMSQPIRLKLTWQSIILPLTVEVFYIHIPVRIYKHSGGLMAYKRSDIPSRQRKYLGPENSLCTIIEALLNKQKLCFVTYYNPPSTSDAVFKDILSKSQDNVTAHYSNYVICDD